MDKNKKGTVKKMLIRNAEQKVKPTVLVIKEPNLKNKFIHVQTQDLSKNEQNFRETNVNNFAAPELNSTLRLVRDMKQMKQIKPRRIKSVNDISEVERKIIEEKVTKKVNIPLTENVYKDLIALELNSPDIALRTTYSTHSREVTTPKDIEPRLSDFYSIPKKKEYNVIVNPIIDNSAPIKQYDGLRLSKLARIWKYNALESDIFSN